MDNFLEAQRPPKRSQKEMDSLNRPSLDMKKYLEKTKQTKTPPPPQKSRTTFQHKRMPANKAQKK